MSMSLVAEHSQNVHFGSSLHSRRTVPLQFFLSATPFYSGSLHLHNIDMGALLAGWQTKPDIKP
ncbi:hypothetical protein BM221_005508 [Beauveria bassiana]|uniref:Uncharacterized protein n=1 Tax=Beauveria bassiana TaxID=176275 RepID=A0A2N6NNR7_BEABA|nr:hypothetical protein BM221_005508 [Beauveria bassiana]